MTDKEFIINTIKYYTEDKSRFAIDGPIYKSFKSDDRYCAIGRWIKPEAYTTRMEHLGNVRSLLEQYPDCLMDEVKDVSLEALEATQRLHDGVLHPTKLMYPMDEWYEAHYTTFLEEWGLK